MLRHIGPDGGKDALALTADAAAQQDHLRGKAVDQIGQTRRHIDTPPVNDRLRRGVARVGGLKHIQRRQLLPAMKGGLGMLFSGPLALTDQGGGGGIRLPAAVAAAGAVLALQHQQGMAQLRAHGAHTGVNFAVDDDAAAHAGAQRNEDHVAAAHRRARHGLRQRGAVGVVAEMHGDAEALVEHPAHRHIEPAQIIGPQHHARLAVAGAGGADADAGAVGGDEARLLQRHLHGAAHVGHHLLRRAEGSGGDAGLGNDGMAVVHHAHGDVGAAQIDTDTIHGSFLPLTAAWLR